MGFWERRFPHKAAEVAARKTYAVTKRGSTAEDGAAEAYILQFYPRADSAKLASMHFEDLQSGHSADDNWEKRSSLGLFLFLFLLPVAGLFVPALFRSSHNPLVFAAVVYFILLVAMVVPSVVVSAWLKVNFNNMNNLWENAIRGFLDNDLQNKFNGIRNCMLEFRRFIKWRRYMTYVVWWALPIFALVEILLLSYGLSRDGALDGWYEQLGLGLFLFATVLVQAGVIARYSYFRWYYTDYRDPTLQFCVMLAEENRDYVGLLQRGNRP